MPLVDPVTMSSSARTTGPATAPKAKSRTDEPTPTNPGLLAQQATHIVPVLQLALFAGRFGTLVADPVATMTSTLPFVAALQVAYALICLPPAGAGSAAAAKLPKKTGRADRKKPAAAQGAAPNVYVTALLALALTGFATFAINGVVILVGGPLLDQNMHTLLLSANIALLAFFPLFYAHGVNGDAWAAIATLGRPLDDSFGGLWGGVIGAWLGAVPIPLDWDCDWQRWPVTILCGLYGGYALGKLVGGTVGYGYKINSMRLEDAIEGEMEDEVRQS